MFILPKLQGSRQDIGIYLTGLSFALLSAGVTLAYASLFKSYGAKQSRLTPPLVAFTTFAMGSVLVLPLALFSTPQLLQNLVQPNVWAIALGLGVLSTVVPTLCCSYAAKHLYPILTTALNLMTPIFAAIAAAISLGEYWSWWNMVGAALIPTGILTLSFPQPQVKPQSCGDRSLRQISWTYAIKGAVGLWTKYSRV